MKRVRESPVATTGAASQPPGARGAATGSRRGLTRLGDRPAAPLLRSSRALLPKLANELLAHVFALIGTQVEGNEPAWRLQHGQHLRQLAAPQPRVKDAPQLAFLFHLIFELQCFALGCLSLGLPGVLLAIALGRLSLGVPRVLFLRVGV